VLARFFWRCKGKKRRSPQPFPKGLLLLSPPKPSLGLRPRPCFLAVPGSVMHEAQLVTGGNKSRQFPPGVLLAEGGVSCPKSCPITRIWSLVFVTVLSALVCAPACVIARLGSAAPGPSSLSRLGGASPSGRTGARRKFAPGFVRLASALKSARGSAGASSPRRAITRPRPRERSFAASMRLISWSR